MNPIILSIDEAQMPALLAALRCFVDAERAVNAKGHSLAFGNGDVVGLADVVERIRLNFIRQRDEHYAAKTEAENEEAEEYYRRMMDDDEAAAREDAAESDR